MIWTNKIISFIKIAEIFAERSLGESKLSARSWQTSQQVYLLSLLDSLQSEQEKQIIEETEAKQNF